MKLLTLTLSAALISGAAYGGSGYEFLEQMRQQEYQAQVHEQLEEIQAQQRQIHYELEQRQHFQEQQCEPRHFWLTPLDLECE